jgi:ribose-phosphate pyrophosphokinase
VSTVVLALPGNDGLGADLAARLAAEHGRLTVRRFPDGESYVRIETPIAGRTVVVACTLDRPDAKIVPLLLLAATARDLGAAAVGLVAPYLAYMRQDTRFQAGEGVTAAYVARLLAAGVDWLVTVDPHLHRIGSLAELYAIPAVNVRAAPAIAAWIRATVPDAVLIGPDRESAQWVHAVAAMADVPCEVLEKTRRGDRDVEITVPGLARWHGRTPVLVDDIISTAHTMIAAVDVLRRHVGTPPVCVGVHAVFADDAYEELLAARPARVVTCNTIAHASNAIDVRPLIAAGVRERAAAAEHRHG